MKAEGLHNKLQYIKEMDRTLRKKIVKLVLVFK